MNTTVWTLQIIVASALAMSGFIIILLPKDKLATRLSWVKEYSDPMRYFICSSKIIGAIGLIFPLYLNILPLLTPIAGFGIAIFMILAMAYHLKKKEYKDIPATVIFFGLALFIAVYRLHSMGYCLHN